MIPVRETASRHRAALSLELDWEKPPLPLSWTIAILFTHLLGLSAVARLTHQPFWPCLLALLLILPAALSARTRRLQPLSESLAPLFIVYMMLLLRVVLASSAGFRNSPPGAPSVPDPWGTLLDLSVATSLAGVWVLLAQAGAIAGATGRLFHRSTLLGYLAALLAFTWAVAAYLAVATHGVTASDPYAYVQMAVDIATRATPVHLFPLARFVESAGLPTWPAVPVGYLPPDPLTGASATVWPPGYSALLAAGYLLAGEPALYLLTPLLGLATLASTWWLCREALLNWPECRGILASGIAVMLLATSYEQLSRLAVPMADIPSQLFTTLAVAAALRARRGPVLPFAILAGLCLGAAFSIRYTQLLVGLALLLAWVPLLREAPGGRGRFALALSSSAAAAWVVALPVLAYHTVAFGGPLSVGSGELDLFGWNHLSETVLSLLEELLRPNEFLFLLPFVAWGALLQWRASRPVAVVMIAWVGAIILFHLPYSALRLRDLLSIYPVLAIWAAVGATGILPGARLHPLPTALEAGKALTPWVIVGCLWLRTSGILPLALPENTAVPFFGSMTAQERASFDRLARSLPAGSVVATSLNAGAVALYTQSDPVRPGAWSPEEWLSCVNRLLGQHREVFLLVDGTEMESPLGIVQAHFHLEVVQRLPLPFFSPGGQERREVAVYRVTHP